MQTQIRGNWPTAKKVEDKKPVKKLAMRAPVPLEQLSISDDPPPLRGSTPGGHYTPIFKQLKPGQRLICPPDRAHALANTIKDWLARRGIKARVRSSERYPKDGMGGVWYFIDDSKKSN